MYSESLSYTFQVLVQTLAASVNPADINTIQGVYAVKPPLPAVGGNEAVGRVLAVGPKVSSLPKAAQLAPGDTVITRRTGLGTWSTHMTSAASSFYKLPTKDVKDDDQLATVATLSVNPCTAYRMLVDFGELTSGDVVVQNGANSAVGQAVIQIAKALGLKTLNIVRDRPDFDELQDFLTSLGMLAYRTITNTVNAVINSERFLYRFSSVILCSLFFVKSKFFIFSLYLSFLQPRCTTFLLFQLQFLSPRFVLLYYPVFVLVDNSISTYCLSLCAYILKTLYYLLACFSSIYFVLTLHV
jgi:hypothetical protein